MSDQDLRCFVVSAIGDPESSVRKRADQVLRHVIEPVLQEEGFTVFRADKLGEPGLITQQMVRHILEDELVVADLTGRNPNVYYELAIRHAIQKPLVQLLGQDESLPFDVQDTRTITFDHRDLDSVAEAREELRAQVVKQRDDPQPVASPISTALDLEALSRAPDTAEAALGRVLEEVASLRGAIRALQQQQQQSAGSGMVTPGSYGNIGRITADPVPVFPSASGSGVYYPVRVVTRDMPSESEGTADEPEEPGDSVAP